MENFTQVVVAQSRLFISKLLVFLWAGEVSSVSTFHSSQSKLLLRSTKIFQELNRAIWSSTIKSIGIVAIEPPEDDR